VAAGKKGDRGCSAYTRAASNKYPGPAQGRPRHPQQTPTCTDSERLALSLYYTLVHVTPRNQRADALPLIGPRGARADTVESERCGPRVPPCHLGSKGFFHVPRALLMSVRAIEGYLASGTTPPVS